MPDFLLSQPGGDVTIAAEPGETILAAVQRAGQVLQTVCKGRGMCGACRVRLGEAFLARLAAPSLTEARLLNYLQSAASSRLACQIRLDDSLNGLRVTPDPVLPRTLQQEKTP